MSVWYLIRNNYRCLQASLRDISPHSDEIIIIAAQPADISQHLAGEGQTFYSLDQLRRTPLYFLIRKMLEVCFIDRVNVHRDLNCLIEILQLPKAMPTGTLLLPKLMVQFKTGPPKSRSPPRIQNRKSSLWILLAMASLFLCKKRKQCAQSLHTNRQV